MKRKDLIGIKDLAKTEIEEILRCSDTMRGILQSDKKTDTLYGKNVVSLFYENSTRTRTSFNQAARILGANVESVNASASSVQKGESLIDTGKTLDALKTDIIVIRHSMAGAANLLAANVSASVINAGDGCNEHPTQALLDLYAVKRRFGEIRGLKVVIIGDIIHSRVARSDIRAFNKMGAKVTVCAPYSLLPDSVGELGVSVETDLLNAMAGADVIMALRMQLERNSGALISGMGEFRRFWGIDGDVLKKASERAILMHPAPINRGVEVTGAAADGEQSVITDQVTCGLCVRMAVMSMLKGGAK